MSQEQLIEEGKDLISKLHFSEAEQRFQLALQQDSQSIEALYWLSLVSFMGLENDKGTTYLEKALKIDPENARTLALKGIHLLTTGDSQQAIEQLNKAKQMDPTLPMVYSNLASAYCDAGKLDLAEEAAREAIRLNANDFMARTKLSYVLGRTGRLKDGILELLECIRINPVYVKPYLILGELYIRGRQERAAVALYMKGLKHNPKAFPLRERLCDFYVSKSRYDLAYREAIELVTRRKFYGDYLRIGTYAVAIEATEKARKAFKKLRESEMEDWPGLDLNQLYEKTKIPKPPEAVFGEVERILEEATIHWVRPIIK